MARAAAERDLAIGDGTNHMSRKQVADFIAHDCGRFFVADVNIEFTGVYGDGDTVVVEERTRRAMRTN